MFRFHRQASPVSTAFNPFNPFPHQAVVFGIGDSATVDSTAVGALHPSHMPTGRLPATYGFVTGWCRRRVVLPTPLNTPSQGSSKIPGLWILLFLPTASVLVRSSNSRQVVRLQLSDGSGISGIMRLPSPLRRCYSGTTGVETSLPASASRMPTAAGLRP